MKYFKCESAEKLKINLANGTIDGLHLGDIDTLVACGRESCESSENFYIQSGKPTEGMIQAVSNPNLVDINQLPELLKQLVKR